MDNDIFLEGYQILKIPIIDELGRSAWPELYSEEAIQKMKEHVGLRAFKSQMLLEPIALDKLRLNPASLVAFEGELEIVSCNLKFAFKIDDFIVSHYAFYWDPSSAKRGADGSVCVFLFINPIERKFFIKDVLYLKVDDNDIYPMRTQCQKVLDFMTRHKINSLSVEVNGLGNALPEIIRQEANARFMKIVINKVVSRENKATRIIDAIEPLLSMGRLFIHRSLLGSPLVREFKDFVVGQDGFDDAIDALAGAILAVPSDLKVKKSCSKFYTASSDFTI